MKIAIIALLIALVAMDGPVSAQPAVEPAPTVVEEGWTFFDYLGVAGLVVAAFVVADIVTGGAVSGPFFRTLAWAGEATGAEGLLARTGVARNGAGQAAGAAIAAETGAAPTAIRIQGVVAKEAVEAIVVNGQKLPCLRFTVCGAAQPMGALGTPITVMAPDGRPLRLMVR